MKTPQDLWTEAYLAGYLAGKEERDYDPGDSMPESLDQIGDTQ